jgi:hypothetical protein
VTVHVAEINSFNMKYVFKVRYTPANFRLTLQTPDSKGQMVSHVASLTKDLPGHLATVAFNPQSTGFQNFTIQHSRGQTTLLIKPRLREQLGAFVIPHMLLGVVYEPPGRYSYASYRAKNTVGTVLSVGSSLTSGMIERVNPGDIRSAIFGAASGGASAVGAPQLAIALKVIDTLLPKEAFFTERTDTTATTESAGTFFSVAHDFTTTTTDDYVYPGAGDLFVVMTDVMFVYRVRKDKVYLAPIAYTTVHKWRASDLRAYAPPDVAEKFIALDPHFNAEVKFDLQKAAPVEPPKIPGGPGDVGDLGFSRRFEYRGHTACDPGGDEGVEFTTEDYRSTTASALTSENRIYQMSGLLASLFGMAGEWITTVTYSRSIQQVTIQEEQAYLSLKSDDAEGSFDVSYYFDRVFRTFVALRGEPLTSTPAIAGILTDEQGRPAARRQVILATGGRRYTVHSDARGIFRFRFRSMPAGTGALIVGKSTRQVAYRGTPVTVNLRIPRSQLPAPRPQREPR